ncbi:hypothetical protein LR48_Vigan02g086300 [Vigna angularis]|uniref:Uncharacterized protein n=1 Tax=Phaseolus angularis TaxID=3914 RepID=A0A0L9TVU5_PHAAN|nr:hypothetical protein LR48_Vigan02g086300 [Vigna angularis]
MALSGEYGIQNQPSAMTLKRETVYSTSKLGAQRRRHCVPPAAARLPHSTTTLPQLRRYRQPPPHHPQPSSVIIAPPRCRSKQPRRDAVSCHRMLRTTLPRYRAVTQQPCSSSRTMKSRRSATIASPSCTAAVTHNCHHAQLIYLLRAALASRHDCIQSRRQQRNLHGRRITLPLRAASSSCEFHPPQRTTITGPASEKQQTQDPNPGLCMQFKRPKSANRLHVKS